MRLSCFGVPGDHMHACTARLLRCCLFSPHDTEGASGTRCVHGGCFEDSPYQATASSYFNAGRNVNDGTSQGKECSERYECIAI